MENFQKNCENSDFKKCRMCHLQKELSCFRKVGRSIGNEACGYQAVCKQCISTKSADTRAQRNNYGKYATTERYGKRK